MAPPVERRAKKRFPIDRPARYRRMYTAALGPPASGRVLEASSSSVWLETETPVPVGQAIEILIDWPASLEGVVPLYLKTAGVVLRVEGNRAAVSVERYEFRTRATSDSGMGRNSSPGEL